MSKFSERLKALGFDSYSDYLNSEHWQDFKRRYRKSGCSCKCAVCGCGKIQLHHHSYARIGAEKFDDMTPLCREHHLAVHEWLKERKKGNVQATVKAVKALCREARDEQPEQAQEKVRCKRKKKRLSEAMVDKLHALQEQTQMIPKRKCDNVVAHDDAKSVQRFIGKMSGKTLDRRKNGRKPKHSNRPVAPASSPEQPKVKLEKHSEYVARTKRAGAVLRSVHPEPKKAQPHYNGFCAAAIILAAKRPRQVLNPRAAAKFKPACVVCGKPISGMVYFLSETLGQTAHKRCRPGCDD